MRRKSLLVIGAGAALLALTACGPGVAGSATPVGGGTPAAQGQPQGGGDQKISTVSQLGSVVQHNASAKSSVHVDMSTTGSSVNVTSTGDMRFAGARSAMHLSMTLPGAGGIELILVDGTMYMKLPAGLNTSGKPWIKFDTSGSDPVSQALGSTAQMAQQSDPGTLIDKIKSAGTINSTTQDTVNGEATTHYSITVDTKKMAAGLAATDAEKAALSQLTAPTMPFDLWVDSDNLPVKIVSKLATAAPGIGAVAETTTMVYSNWGENVTIAAPPADQVGTVGGH